MISSSRLPRPKSSQARANSVNPSHPRKLLSCFRTPSSYLLRGGPHGQMSISLLRALFLVFLVTECSAWRKLDRSKAAGADAQQEQDAGSAAVGEQRECPPNTQLLNGECK